MSDGPRSSLNLGFRWGDSEENVFANRRLVAEHVGFRYEDLTVTKHVHGVDVWTVGDPLPEPPEFDGMVSTKPGAVLGAFAADCVPMVLADPKNKVCGAAHSGWRGTVNGIAANMVSTMKEKGAKAHDIQVALGPCIGVCCFEVGDEVVLEFESKLGSVDGMVVDGPKKKHIDLRKALEHQFLAAGLSPENIDWNPPCTKCNPEPVSYTHLTLPTICSV